MMLSPTISIITPSFNQGKFLEKTIQSVLSQQYPNTEYIIIDGGSSDDSVNVIKKYENQLSYWVSEKDRGQSHAFNKGLAKATGEIIGWINSDDIYLGESLFQAARYFQDHSTVDIVFSDYWYIDETGKFIKRRKEIPFVNGVYLWTGDCYHANCAGFFRKRVFEKIGGLDESLHFGMDYELYLRAAKAGCVFGHEREYWGAYRLHGESKSIRSHHLQQQDAMKILNRYKPAMVSPLGIWYRREGFKLFRIIWKFFLGSYFPPTSSAKAL